MIEDALEDPGRRYLEALGEAVDGRVRLSIDELGWLVGHSTRLGGLRLELLKALQSALPGAGDSDDVVGELKDLLTNLIIMQSRLSGRDEELGELLSGLDKSGALNGVPVDESIVRSVVDVILQGPDHVQEVARD